MGMTSSNGNICHATGPLWGEPPVIKASDAELFFLLMCAWTNGWANNRDVGGLRRHRAHYDVTVMNTRSVENIHLYLPRCSKENCKRNLLYKGSFLWNQLPSHVKEYYRQNDFKHIYIIYIYMCVCACVCVRCIFYSVTGHHGRTVWMSGPPCINIFEIKNNVLRLSQQYRQHWWENV